MKTVKKMLRSAKVNQTNLFHVEMLEEIDFSRNSDIIFINIYLNNELILTSKPISMKLLSCLMSGKFTDVKEAFYLLSVNNKIKKDDKKIFSLIKKLVNL